ncbi:hypothetical protein, partial [Phocaeicola vulgatus]|uniref:hypothetical protein n=1 Tax=Phocaeicola vulgatus TaxID=821 RepID=UPI001C380D6B
QKSKMVTEPFFDKNSSISYIFFIICYCHFQSPFIMAYRYTRLAKSLSFTGVANYQGMSRHMDMRTLRIQSAEALPEAP